MDMAASVQAITEEIMLRAAKHVQYETGMKNLVLAGGVALNCVGNGRILRESPFDWYFPYSIIMQKNRLFCQNHISCYYQN
jgi:predicted NodU family carbamoyl transferase